MNSADDQNQPLFDAQFLFHKFIDQHKGNFSDLVLSD
jgi:hypothetical protein